MDVLNYLSTCRYTYSLDNVLMICLLVFLIIVIIRLIYDFMNRKVKKKLKVVNMSVSIANIGNIELELDNNISKIAHDAWVEIMTRKVGIEFEEDKDVIVEVYNSWYKLFGIIRDLLKEVDSLNNENVKRLENVLLDVLNKGLRPHLTTWQAKFRKWYDNKCQSNLEKTPQEIQKEYEEYDELVTDLKNVNRQMMQFAKELEKLF